MIAEQWRDIGTGRIHEQLPDYGTIEKPLPELRMMDDSGKLMRESGDNNDKVRQLKGHVVDDTPYIFQEQLETIKYQHIQSGYLPVSK
jgi:hypothetical protein